MEQSNLKVIKQITMVVPFTLIEHSIIQLNGTIQFEGNKADNNGGAIYTAQRQHNTTEWNDPICNKG